MKATDFAVAANESRVNWSVLKEVSSNFYCGEPINLKLIERLQPRVSAVLVASSRGLK